MEDLEKCISCGLYAPRSSIQTHLKRCLAIYKPKKKPYNRYDKVKCDICDATITRQHLKRHKDRQHKIEENPLISDK